MTAWELFYLFWGLSMGWASVGMAKYIRAEWRERHRWEPEKSVTVHTKSHWGKV
jgi:hypothetical protein